MVQAKRGDFEYLEAQICNLDPLSRERASPSPETRALDWRDVYMAIRNGIMIRAGFYNLPPEWCQDRDDAMRRLDKAVTELHRVCKLHPTASEPLLKLIEPLAG
jgi:hypothetical protein